MDKLLKIASVTDYRSLQGWSPPDDLRPFATYNVIYGSNGTGKTTLAALLHDQANGTATPGLRIVVGPDSATGRVVTQATDPFWKTVRVFNSDYVSSNLRFEDASGSTAEPLLVLGEKRVGAEKERDKAAERIGEIDKELPDLKREARTEAAARDKLLTDTARTISEELQGVAPRYAPRSYRSPQVQVLLDQDGWHAKSSVDVAQDLRIAQGPTLPEHVLPASEQFSAKAITDEVETALSETAQSVAINNLVEHPDWNRWVGQGVGLHEHLESCLYCGASITPDRKAALAAHFDESLARLEARLRELGRSAEQLQSAATGALSRLPRPDEIAETYRDEYGAAVKAAESKRSGLVDHLEELETALKGKRDQLFKPMPLPSATVPSTVSMADIATIIERHNEYVKDTQTHRQEAAERVEHARIAAIADAFGEAKKTASAKEAKVASLTAERDELRAVVARADEVDLDPLPIAERLNTDLAQLLGRDDLKFIPYERGYQILRNGKPAAHLSEGERNAISLLYFLRSLATHNADCAKSVVMIDDPVSSLDQNTLLAASALLWSRLVEKCGQLIILTHNFEFFRTWSYQLQAAKSKLSKGDKQYYSLYEMHSGAVADGRGGFRRQPRIIDWPTDYFMQKRLRSEYHYLFWTAGRSLADLDENPSPELELQAAAILPNVCRRLLESFLAFHNPGFIGSLNEQVNTVDSPDIDKDVRTRVIRFAHTYSHSEDVDLGRPLSRPDTLENVRAVLAFMKAIDPRHFEGMCHALEVNL